MKNVYPGSEWSFRSPEETGLFREPLENLSKLVKGQGSIVRHGYMVYTWGEQCSSTDVASASKPILSLLLMHAVQEGLIGSPDDRVSLFEPLLNGLNNGKDGGITWRHLASQTSGYGLAEAPGEAFSYNDYAMALYYDTLTQKVFRQHGTELIKKYFAVPLGFQDAFTYEAFGPLDRPGRLAVSVRDFARIGLLCLRHCRWQDRQLLDPDLFRMAVKSLVPADTPMSSRMEADMLPGQRSLGGGKWIHDIGPGYYSFNWWVNGTDMFNRILWPQAPSDAYCALGHAGKRILLIIPSADMVVCWNNGVIEDLDECPSNPGCLMNRAVGYVMASIKLH